MSDEVTFDEEDSIVPQRPKAAEKKSTFTKLIIQWGLAKDDKQAQYVLLGIAVVGIAITFFNIFVFLVPH